MADEKQTAYKAIHEALQILQEKHYSNPQNCWRLKEDLARALHRRHLIGAIATGRIEARFYQRESDLDTTWKADGRTRAYWYQLADEAISVMLRDELTALPKPEEWNGRL